MSYYKIIMGEQEDSFIQVFNDLWRKEIDSHETSYGQAAQLTTGNRLRPIIMAWGYYANASKPNNIKIAQYAVCVELIHKASILLDDWIDGDVARRGRKSFHVEHSSEEAVLYAIYLINRSLKIISSLDITLTGILLETIERMSLGGIMEVSQTNALSENRVLLVKKIIDFETTTLIENAFTIGYRVSNNGEVRDEIKSIGNCMGYCFQLLNDLEPFMNVEQNVNYKGGHNFDVNKKRKNIVIAYLYGACSKCDRIILSKKPSYDEIEYLIKEYDIITFILGEVSSYVKLIKDDILSLENSLVLSDNYISHFHLFLNTMFHICYEKLGLSFAENSFN